VETEFSIEVWTDCAGKDVVFQKGRGEREREERQPTHLCLGAASKDPITFLRRGRREGVWWCDVTEGDEDGWRGRKIRHD
jgi:hypothetical protein